MIKPPHSRSRRRRPRHDVARIIYYIPEIATVGPSSVGRHSLGYFLYTHTYAYIQTGFRFLCAHGVILTPPSSAFF